MDLTNPDDADWMNRGRQRHLETMIFGDPVDWHATTGVVRRFDVDVLSADPLAPETARELLNKDYVRPDQRHNNSPTAETIVSWAERLTGVADGVGVIGFVTSPAHENARIEITGLTIEDADDDVRKKLAWRFDGSDRDAADQFGPKGDYDLRVWWD